MGFVKLVNLMRVNYTISSHSQTGISPTTLSVLLRFNRGQLTLRIHRTRKIGHHRMGLYQGSYLLGLGIHQMLA